MNAKLDVEKTIDQWNEEFTGNARKPLKDLSRYSTESLEWLMMEHYQFSFRNCQLLWDAAQATGGFDNDSVKKELVRNFEEESSHAAMYKAALKKVGADVDTRREFKPTTDFLNSVGELCQRDPSFVLGTMFATETAAIFEHQVFRDVSEEVIARRGSGGLGKPLVAFHDLHLDGVEQSHKDELGIFLRNLYEHQEVAPAENNRPTIHPRKALAGGQEAVVLMTEWWGHLFAELKSKNSAAAATV